MAKKPVKKKPVKKIPAKKAAKPVLKAQAKKTLKKVLTKPTAKPAVKAAKKAAPAPALKGKKAGAIVAKPVAKPVAAKPAVAKAKAAKPIPVKVLEKQAKKEGKSGKAPKAAKESEVTEVVTVEETEEETVEEVYLTDAEGRRFCRVRDCDQLAVVEAYCRYHYLLNWKRIQVRKKILTEGKLERYIEELTARYPDKFLEMLRKDLRSEKEFLGAIQELEIDESAIENEMEDEAQTYIDEVRGMGEAAGERQEEDF